MQEEEVVVREPDEAIAVVQAHDMAVRPLLALARLVRVLRVGPLGQGLLGDEHVQHHLIPALQSILNDITHLERMAHGVPEVYAGAGGHRIAGIVGVLEVPAEQHGLATKCMQLSC